MPRIAFEYEGSNKWYEETDEGTSTFDVCTDCDELYEDSRHLLEDLKGPYNGEPTPTKNEKVTHHDIGVENPSLHDGEQVTCECCGELLILNENY